MDASITIFENDHVCVDRRNRFILASLKRPHCVLSTSPVNSAYTEHLTCLVNHQSCEAAGHADRFDVIMGKGPVGYHHHVCDELGIDPKTTASMGTAANMQYAAVVTKNFEEFAVTAIVTAGVTGNAGRAGDPARYIERSGKYEHINSGTINTILLFNTSLTPAAITRAAATMTEAKSASLQNLAVRSRISQEVATGTGTDQFCIAALLADDPVISWTGKHSKVGELIGLSVTEATSEALRWQNGLEMSLTRRMTAVLERWGFDREFFEKRLADEYDGERLAFFKRNYDAIVHDPQASACAFAIAAVQDRVACGGLPVDAGRESVLNQCALLAATIAAQPGAYGKMRNELVGFQNAGLAEIVFQSLCLGWVEKWN